MKHSYNEYVSAKIIVDEYEQEQKKLEEKELQESKDKLLKEQSECNHEFIPTNAKYQSVCQVVCIYCGLVRY